MGHQRCAGCLGRKAEFPCGLMKESAQRFITNTVESIAPPMLEHVSTTYNHLRGRRGGARGGEMAFATMNASPPRDFLSFEKRKNFRLSDEEVRGILTLKVLSACRIVAEFLDEI